MMFAEKQRKNIVGLENRNKDKKKVMDLKKEKGEKKVESLTRRLKRVKDMYKEQELQLKKIEQIL